MDREKYQDKLADVAFESVMPARDSMSSRGCSKRDTKLNVYDYLHDFPEMQALTKMVEVQFKNTRKGFYINNNNIDLQKGDMVAVEASPGHDIGTVTLTGKLVDLQMRKYNYREDPVSGPKKIYRIARPNDIEKYEMAKAREQATMIRAREIASNLGLSMKIGDVEFQGDGSKAIFYYIADERVDFRQLIKDFASEFRIKIEMKQIGARQEAGRIGGIGACGREMCCSSWMTNFVSVSTVAVRYQDIAFNPQKLAGQCGKLKCCMNYEVDMYVEASRKLPSREIVLHTRENEYYHFKTDILLGKITYSTDKNMPINLETISKERAFQVIEMNKKGRKPFQLSSDDNNQTKETRFDNDILGDESITRFDNKKRSSQNKRRNRRNRPGGNRNRGTKPTNKE